MRKIVFRALALCLGVLMPLSLTSIAWADDDDDDDDGGGTPPYWNNAGPVDPDEPVVIYADQPTVDVEYEVTGSVRSADIQFVGEGGLRRFVGFVLPFHRKAKAWPPVQQTLIFATVPMFDDWTVLPNGESRRQGGNGGRQPSGSLTCRLWVSGKLVQERTTHGTNHAAKCAATVRFFE